MGVNQFSEVLRLLLIEDFVSDQHHLLLDSFGDRQPVEFVQNWCDVISSFGTGYNPRESVLYTLKLR